MVPELAKYAVMARMMRPPSERRGIGTWGWVAILGGGGLALYAYSQLRGVREWMSRMDEPDVQTAGFLAAYLGPPGLSGKIMNMIPGVSWVKDLWEKAKQVVGEGKKDYVKQAMSRVQDWELVQKAYKGLTRSDVTADMHKAMKREDVEECLQTMRDSVERWKRGGAERSAIRAQFLANLQKALEGKPAETIYVVKNEGWENWQMTVVVDQKGTKAPGGGGGGAFFTAGTFIGTPTKQVWKDRRGNVKCQIATNAGPLWFPSEKLTIWVPK